MKSKYKEFLQIISKKFFEEQTENRNLKAKIIALNKSIRHYQSKKYVIEQSQKLLCDRGYGKAEINFILFGRQSRNLSPDDVKTGIVVSSLSNRAYRYLKNKKSFYLPSMSTIRARKKKYLARYGFQDQFLRYINENSSYDKMQIKFSFGIFLIHLCRPIFR